MHKLRRRKQVRLRVKATHSMSKAELRSALIRAIVLRDQLLLQIHSKKTRAGVDNFVARHDRLIA